jgi:hypothetical protein
LGLGCKGRCYWAKLSVNKQLPQGDFYLNSWERFWLEKALFNTGGTGVPNPFRLQIASTSVSLQRCDKPSQCFMRYWTACESETPEMGPAFLISLSFQNTPPPANP